LKPRQQPHLFVFIPSNTARSFLLLEGRLATPCSSNSFNLFIPTWSLIHSAKRCCYRKSFCDGVLCV